MTDHCKQTRDDTLARFAAHASAMFAAKPERRSVMLAVAQYWNDSADDEVHGRVIASTRATPVWPHECEYDYGENDDDEPAQRPALPGEECWMCGGSDVDISFYGGYGDAMVAAFEPFCREGASQGQDAGDAYVPFAIARRVDARVEVELVGHVQRPPTLMIGSAVAAYDWPDARARELFEQVCLHPADNSPRAVLADYLLEHHDDVRGEAIALALAGELDAESRARCDALFAANAERWLAPLGDVIAAGCAHFERGFLARVDVHASAADRDRVVGATTWGTVHTIRFTPDSCDVIGPTMTALRDVGPMRDDGVHAIVRATRPWAIERLRVGPTARGVEALAGTRALPRLSTLELAATHREALGALRGAPYRIVVVEREYGSLADWRALRAQLDVPELAVALGDELASAWEIGFRADDSVTVRGGEWHGQMTLAQLAALLDQLPATTRIQLVSSPRREMAAGDVAYLRSHAERDISLAPKPPS